MAREGFAKDVTQYKVSQEMRVGKGDFGGQSKHVCKGPEAEWDLMHQETDPRGNW